VLKGLRVVVADSTLLFFKDEMMRSLEEGDTEVSVTRDDILETAIEANGHDRSKVLNYIDNNYFSFWFQLMSERDIILAFIEKADQMRFESISRFLRGV
jgi:histidyl-tRNA synthetase